MLNKDTLISVAELYGLERPTILNTQSGYRNQVYPMKFKTHTLCFILYKNDPRILNVIKNINDVGLFLSKKSFPVRRPESPKILKVKIGSHSRYGCLYNYLPGSTLPWEGYTKDHLKVLGQNLSDMHATLQSYSETSRFESMGEHSLKQIYKMEAYFTNPGVITALTQKLGVKLTASFYIFSRLFRYVNQTDNTQLLHMDFVRGNILFDKAGADSNLKYRISGILDFEKMAVGPIIVDVARTYAFLLVDSQYKSSEDLQKYFIESGYLKRGESHFQDKILIIKEKRFNFFDLLVDYFLFYDFYKFLKHNPYESLTLNNHYIRTVHHLNASHLIDLS